MILRLLIATVAWLLAVGPAAGQAPDPDRFETFEGMHRDAVAVLLGPPHKVKRARGETTLIYKLKVVSEDYLPTVNERLLVIPDHGPCVSVVGNDTGFDETVAIEPTRTDREGRPVDGGVTRSYSTSIDLDKGERFEAPEVPPGRVVGKLKLKLELDGDRVVRWTAR